MVTLLGLGFGTMRTISRYVDRKHGGGDAVRALRAEVDELRAQLDEVDELRGRLGELEDRMEFAERVLSRPPEEDQLPPGQ